MEKSDATCLPQLLIEVRIIMAYQKNTWFARTGTNLNRILDQNGNELILTPAPREVLQQGTPFSVDWMNNMEEGIESVSNEADNTENGLQTHEDNTTIHLPSTGILPINKGGTGATSASSALSNLGAASASHTHSLSSSTITGTLPISKGGTGATSATDALRKLGIKSGEVSVTVPKGEVRGSDVITFDEAYPNTDYIIVVSVYSGIAGGNEGRTATFTAKTATGFELRLGMNNASTTQANSAACSWITMPFTDE